VLALLKREKERAKDEKEKKRIIAGAETTTHKRRGEFRAGLSRGKQK
jgi:hypothetical protein